MEPGKCARCSKGAIHTKWRKLTEDQASLLGIDFAAAQNVAQATLLGEARLCDPCRKTVPALKKGKTSRKLTDVATPLIPLQSSPSPKPIPSRSSCPSCLLVVPTEELQECRPCYRAALGKGESVSVCCKPCMSLARKSYRSSVPTSFEEALSPKKLRGTDDRYERSQKMLHVIMGELSKARNEVVETKAHASLQNKALGLASASKKFIDLGPRAKAVRCLCMT